MSYGEITKLTIPALNEFRFQIKLSETSRAVHTYEIGLHTHREFELYVNLSGDVSFLVENNLYELARGDVIIARPGEHHHCVYRSNAPHRLFWILFDCESNGPLLDFLRDDFRDNYVSPRDDLREELLALCYALHRERLTEEEKLYSFFRMFAILKQSRSAAAPKQSILPRDLRRIMDYIDLHIREELTVAGLAEASYLSQSTLERRFREVLDTTPLEYIRKKRLTLAAVLLREGKSVLTAGTGVGYNDNSYFIELFRRYYGMTPYQYKKKYSKNGR